MALVTHSIVIIIINISFYFSRLVSYHLVNQTKFQVFMGKCLIMNMDRRQWQKKIFLLLHVVLQKAEECV